MSATLIILLVWLTVGLLLGFAFGVNFGRERERRRHLGRKRTCQNCRGWGRIRIGLPIIGLSYPCCDCLGYGYYRDEERS